MAVILPLWATTIEATADLETASGTLGHSGLNITQVYVHRGNRTAAACTGQP